MPVTPSVTSLRWRKGQWAGATDALGVARGREREKKPKLGQRKSRRGSGSVAQGGDATPELLEYAWEARGGGKGADDGELRQLHATASLDELRRGGMPVTDAKSNLLALHSQNRVSIGQDRAAARVKRPRTRRCRAQRKALESAKLGGAAKGRAEGSGQASRNSFKATDLAVAALP